MPQLSFDEWLHVIGLVSFAIAAIKGGLAFRDGLHDMAKATRDLRGDVDDHEDRLRLIEGKPMRRRHDNDTKAAVPFEKKMFGIF